MNIEYVSFTEKTVYSENKRMKRIRSGVQNIVNAIWIHNDVFVLRISDNIVYDCIVMFYIIQNTSRQWSSLAWFSKDYDGV